VEGIQVYFDVAGADFFTIPDGILGDNLKSAIRTGRPAPPPAPHRRPFCVLTHLPHPFHRPFPFIRRARFAGNIAPRGIDNAASNFESISM